MPTKEIIPFITPRVDFEEIIKEYEAASEAAAKCKSLEAFRDLMDPITESIEIRYGHLLDAENYIPGEFAGLLFFLVSQISKLVPKELEHKAVIHESGTKVILVPLTRHDLMH